MSEELEKLCSKCGELKLPWQFPMDRGRRRNVCNVCQNERVRASQRKCRLEVLTAYSNGGVPRCRCCGLTTIAFLELDHIDGGGTAHRKTIHGLTEYWAKRNNYPPGLQVLCANCHSAKTRGYFPCPCQESDERMVLEAATDTACGTPEGYLDLVPRLSGVAPHASASQGPRALPLRGGPPC